MNDKPLPRISVITASLDRGEYLEQAVRSVLDQGYPNLDFVVVDGGSRDLSPLILERYRPHIVAVQSSHAAQGRYQYIQEGIDRATGELVIWLNAEDKFHEGSLWRMAAAAAKFPDDNWFTGLPSTWNQFGALQSVDTVPPCFSADFLCQLPGAAASARRLPAVFFRRKIWQQAGGFLDLTLQEASDLELWLRFSRIQPVKQLSSLFAGTRNIEFPPDVRDVIYSREATAVIEKYSPYFPPTNSPCNGTGGSPWVHRINADFLLATSIAPHKQYEQFKAIRTWKEAGFSVVSFNAPEEIAQLRDNFADVTFVEVLRTAIPIVGKPLVFIKDVLDYLAAQDQHRFCGIINSDISFINTTGILDAFAYHLDMHDALFASRIEVDDPLQYAAGNAKRAGMPSIKHGAIYTWGFDLFLFTRPAAQRLAAEVAFESPFAFGVPWWDYFVPSIAMNLKLRTGILYPPPISHPSHHANYNLALWRMYGHAYMDALGLRPDLASGKDNAPDMSDDFLSNISQQFVQMFAMGSSKIDLGALLHLPDEWPVNLAYGPLDESKVRQLCIIQSYGRDPFLNLSGHLRDKLSTEEFRRFSINLLRSHGIDYGA